MQEGSNSLIEDIVGLVPLEPSDFAYGTEGGVPVERQSFQAMEAVVDQLQVLKKKSQ